MTKTQSIIQELRSICENCGDRRSDNRCSIGGRPFEARTLTTEETWTARYLLFQTAEIIEKRLVTVNVDALDGRKFKYREWLPGIVRSANKQDCFFDPQELKAKLLEKQVNTELMYIHRAECMRRYIGSKFQDGQGGYPLFFRSNDSLMTVSESRAAVTAIMMYDNSAMAKAVDGNVILGDWRSNDGEGTLLNGAHSRYDAVDGVIKQALLQHDNAYYHTVDITIPTIGTGCVYLGMGQQISDSFDNVADLVSAINQLCDNVTGQSNITAVVTGTSSEGTTIRLVANTVSNYAYGYGGLNLFYSADCDVSECTNPLAGVEVQGIMPYAEMPCCVPYQSITEDNFFELMKQYIMKFRKGLNVLFQRGDMKYGDRDWYMAFDPDLLLEKQCAEIEKFCKCQDPEGQLGRYMELFPRFEPLKCLQGTGMFFMTFPQNIMVLTNFQDGRQANTAIWYDPDCDKVKSKNELLLGVILLDASFFLTNACNSNFHQKIGPAYKPENLTHLCEELRQDCCVGSASSDSALQVEVCYEEDGAGGFNLNLSDESVAADGETVDTVEWTIWFEDGTPNAQPTTQAQNVQVTGLAQTQIDAIGMVTYQVTYQSGNSNTATIPSTAIYECC